MRLQNSPQLDSCACSYNIILRKKCHHIVTELLYHSKQSLIFLSYLLSPMLQYSIYTLFKHNTPIERSVYLCFFMMPH